MPKDKKKFNKSSLLEYLGIDRAVFMFQFIKTRIVLYCTGVLLVSSYKFVENIVMGQLFSVTATISIDMNIYDLWVKILTIFAWVTGVILMASFGTAITGRAVAHIDMNFRMAITEKLTKIPMNLWNERHSGDWMALVGKDADTATESYKEFFMTLIGIIFQMLGGIIIIMPRYPLYAWFSLAAGIIYLIIVITLRKKSRLYAQLQREVSAQATARFSDILKGFFVIRIFKMFSVAKKRHDQTVDRAYDAGMKTTVILMIARIFEALGFTISYTGAFIFGLVLVHQGEMDLPQMLALWPIAMGISLSLMDVGQLTIRYQGIVASINRVYKLFQLPDEQSGEMCDAKECPIAVEFKNVTFSYGDTKVLDNISFKIKKGENIALVGASGGGKSTVVKLMMRLYDIQSGTINVSGRDIKSYDLSTLRNQFSYVPQMPYLISDSIYENIALVSESASIEKVILASKQSYADQFITEMPKGYDTLLGDQGVGLSGGQRQRIAIARAFIKNAPIFVFDEATAALDGDSEKKINMSMDYLSHHHTLIVVAHRLSTAKRADRIIIIEDGRVMEQGSHDELIMLEGRYYNLWKEQQITGFTECV